MELEELFLYYSPYQFYKLIINSDFFERSKAFQRLSFELVYPNEGLVILSRTLQVLD